jgi:SSU ribosomal protein S3P
MAVERKFVAEGVRRARVEKYFNKELKRAGFGGMDIARTPIGTQVTIFAEKPGIVIGKGGKLVRQVTQELATTYGVETPPGGRPTGEESQLQCPDHGRTARQRDRAGLVLP